MQKFVDVSNNNGQVDFKAVKAAGAAGVYLKVTEGTGFVDAYYEANYKAAKAAGLKVGGYHFGHPKNSAAQEVSFFLQHLKLEKGDLNPCLDLETTDGQSAATVSHYGSIFLNILKNRIKEAGVLYSGSYFMSANGLLGRPERKWVASYGADPKCKWDAWQFSDGQAQYPGSICKLDTSEIADINLFVYKAPKHKRVIAVVKKHAHKTKHAAKYVVLAGVRVRVGSFYCNYLRGYLKSLTSFKTKFKTKHKKKPVSGGGGTPPKAE
jgi:hypothetical protein